MKAEEKRQLQTSPLLARMLEDSVLTEAWYKVRGNQGRAGVDGVSLADFGTRLFWHLGRLRQQMQSGSYVPAPLLQVRIPKKQAGRFRALAIPTVRDRVLQAALAQVLMPLADSTFEEASYGYRVGRSIQMAVQKIVQLRGEGYRWVVDADIQSYFDEIDHERLLEKLAALTRDPGVLPLVRQWLKAPIRQQGGELLHPEKGVPQGSPLSPLLANLYLDEFDEAIAARGWRLVRYADDFVILCRQREEAESALELTEERLQGLALRLNWEKTRLTRFEEGFDFLGLRFEDGLVIPERAGAAPWLLPQPVYGYKSGDFSTTAMAAALGDAGLVGRATAAPEADEPAPASPATPPGNTDDVEMDAMAPPLMRTLFLLSPGHSVIKAGDRLAVQSAGECLKEIPIHQVDQLMVVGHSSLSSAAIALCAEHDVAVHILRPNRQMAASFQSATPRGVNLRRQQYRTADDDTLSLALAKGMVVAKLKNSHRLMARLLRHHPVAESQARLTEISAMEARALAAATLDEVRGCEGYGARVYFDLMRQMLPPEWGFGPRAANPPPDPINAMLSYGYAVLYGNACTLLLRRGFDTACGYLHTPREGHAALASDLMEPFRAPVVDAVVLALVFRHRVKPESFEKGGGRCQMADEVKRLLIHELEAKLNARPAGESLDLRRLLAEDVAELAAFLQGDADQWAPFVMS